MHHIENDAVRTQLITDLDKFVQQYDHEEAERIAKAEADLRERVDRAASLLGLTI